MAYSTRKNEIAVIQKLIAAVGGRCNVLHRAKIPYLYCQIPSNPPGCWVESGRYRGPGCGDCQRPISGDCNGKNVRPFLRFWIQVKRQRRHLRTSQWMFHDREKACGGKVVVGDRNDVIFALRKMGVEVKGRW